MSQQTHPEHIEDSQADASVLMRYPEVELQTIDPKVRQSVGKLAPSGDRLLKQPDGLTVSGHLPIQSNIASGQPTS